MKHFITFLILVTLMVPSVSAKIWKVGYGINKGDFATIQEAHDAAASGDTIYVSGGVYTPPADIQLSKKVTIFGTGYFLAENPDTQANPICSKINGDIRFNSGADGSMISGLEINLIRIWANNVIIKRNKINLGIGTEGNNTIIEQNYIVNTTTDNWCVATASGVHVIIKNNLMWTHIHNSIYSIFGNDTVELQNNTILAGPPDGYASISIYNSIIKNNIFCNVFVTPPGTGNYSYNNFFCENSGILGSSATDVGSQFGVAVSSLWIGTGSTDGRFLLKPGSPAIGAGVDGVDCGMFGGDDPYVLSGIPAIPTITYFSAPFSGSSATGLPVHMKGKGRR